MQCEGGMTRDEAIKKSADTLAVSSGSVMGGWIDVFVALGMLQLDEPRKYSDDLVSTVRELRSCYDNTVEFLERLEQRGLKIVKK
jgi:polyhydroxyalkanoate synthesis regulator phasin